MANKRDVLRMLLVAGLLGVATPAALADDDSDGGGDSGSSGSGGSGDSGDHDSNDGGSDDHDNDSHDNDSGSGDHSGGSGSSDNDNDDSEQERARKAVERGEAVSLKRVLANVNRKYNGRVVSVSLSGSRPNLRYNIRIIDNQNRLLNLVVNARTGQITSPN